MYPPENLKNIYRAPLVVLSTYAQQLSLAIKRENHIITCTCWALRRRNDKPKDWPINNIDT